LTYTIYGGIIFQKAEKLPLAKGENLPGRCNIFEKNQGTDTAYGV
jgi:hypothetical protein